MNKKLLAVAVAAALAAPLAALADGGNVKISGDLHVSVDSLQGCPSTGCTAAMGMNRNIDASSNSSHIAFSGDEDLGNGLKAVWQLDQQVNMGATASGGGTNTWTSRNSFLGLSGGFGTAIVGKHDTPVKLLGRKIDLFGDQIGDSRNIITDSQAGATGWDLRPDNVIAYISPNFSGFSGVIAYVTNYGTAGTGTADSSPSAPTVDLNAVDAWSGLVSYDNGPLSLGLGYETHNLTKANNATATAPQTFANDESVWRFVGGYGFGDAKVVALYQKEKDLAGTSNGRTTWGIGGAYKLSATTLKLQYYKAGSVDNAPVANGANMLALGVDYALSKRTITYLAYARTDNDTAAAFSAYAGGHGDNPGIGMGLNGSGFSLGMRHSF